MDAEQTTGGRAATDADPIVRLPADLLYRYRRFSLYNSPYPAHDCGRAIDLYPDTETARSPVAGEVLDTKTVGCPDRPYAVDCDHLIVIRVEGEPADADGLFARILHVDPAVAPGDRIAVGDPIGHLVRSGFFGPWVDNHIHLGFRPPDRNPFRARGSLPVIVAAAVEGIDWDGTGTVVETGRTYAVLDAPTHPAPGAEFVAIADDDGRPLDGGLTHYEGGGVLDGPVDDGKLEPPDVSETESVVKLLGTRIGTATGRTIRWRDVDVLADETRIVGLSLFAARDAEYGAKLITRNASFEVGQEVSVAIRPSEDPIRLGPGH
ncbi:Uncharacterized protein AArcCO_1811 [Halalkaliarchaeum sp. AArc-CO]|uniref:hypothetical protein n=1 Tax=unclassified Halalkaliarchaeum TaxID=2678344 RepID=UPI00217D1433|nr:MULTISPECIES: hypothetical protein [unclassified Halalkaliarchaeum]MDR5671608.1 hypothetical protein [Halalkaliarchaeum sp. AArc-GB]UWG51110.1 Uncharacterized protein AArcCO_1811 [Halalkaliarchaeum sp. AArc-CO]